MSEQADLHAIQKEWHGTLRAYTFGFLASLILTSLSFGLVLFQPLSEAYLIYALVALALCQAAFQLLFFLHLGQEEDPAGRRRFLSDAGHSPYCRRRLNLGDERSQ